MAKFNYDNIEAEQLILEFKCSKCCKKTITAKLRVPEMYVDDTYSMNTLSYQHVCECGKEYAIHIHSGIYTEYGEIDDLGDKESDNSSIYVREIPFYPYGERTVFLDTIQAFRISNETINDIESKQIREKSFLYNMLFSNLISLVDSFIKIYAEPIVLSDASIKERFVKVFKQKRKGESEDDFVERFFEERSFQNLDQQKKLLYNVLCLNKKYYFPKELYTYVRIRNLLIHRNGIHKDGYRYKVTKEELLSASKILKDHFCAVHRMLLEKDAEIKAMRIYKTMKR